MDLTRRQGAVLVLATGVVFSFGALFYRATDDVDAWQYLAFRGAGAVGVVGPLLMWRNRGTWAQSGIDRGGSTAGIVLGTLMISFILALGAPARRSCCCSRRTRPAAIFSWCSCENDSG